MKTVLITGGCGFLGQHLIHELLKLKKYKIIVIDLKENSHKYYDFKKEISTNKVKYIYGCDITNYNSIEKYFKDVDIVFHLAGLVSFWRGHKKQLYDVNTIGTKNVIDACLKHNVKKVIDVSSVAAIGYNNDKTKPIDENYDFNWSKIKNKHYMLSKHLAEIEINSAVKKGLNCVIANPGLMYGPGDLNNTPKMISAILRGQIPFNMPGGTNVLDVRDVAKGLSLLIEKGKKGERYILGGYNYSYMESNKKIAKALKVLPPKKNMPKYLHKILYSIFSIVELFSKKQPKLTADNVDSSFMFRYFDSSKAKKELGWSNNISFENTIKDSYEWLKKEKLI